MPRSIPHELALTLSAAVATYGEETLRANEVGEPVPPWALERAMRTARKQVDGLPEGFRYHHLRHYFASLLIGSGADAKVVQRRLRHASAMTTLNTYGHMWPDADESTRAAVAVVLAEPADSPGNTQRLAD